MQIAEKSIELSFNKRLAEKMHEEFSDSVALSHERTWFINAIRRFIWISSTHSTGRFIWISTKHSLSGTWPSSSSAHPRSRCSPVTSIRLRNPLRWCLRIHQQMHRSHPAVQERCNKHYIQHCQYSKDHQVHQWVFLSSIFTSTEHLNNHKVCKRYHILPRSAVEWHIIVVARYPDSYMYHRRKRSRFRNQTRPRISRTAPRTYSSSTTTTGK